MAQTPQTTKKSTSRNTSGAKPSSPRKKGRATGAGASRASKRGSKNGARPRSSDSRSSRSNSQPRANSQSVGGAIIAKAKAAGQTASVATSKARTPLIAGGTAVVGAAAGLVIKDRLSANRSKGPLKRISELPKSAAKLNPGNLDLKKAKSFAERVSAYGQQASDILAATEKTQKKHG